MISTDTVRKLLAVADVAKDPYAVAAGAASLMAQGADAEATQYYLKALSALRLPAAGFRMLNTPVQTGAAGLIPWSSRARRFTANIKALELLTPRGAALVAEAAHHLKSFELYQAGDGNYQVLDIRQPVPTAWVGGLANHKSAALAWQFDRAQTPIPLPVAFDGLAFGWPLLRVLETTANSFLNYSCAVYLLETEPHSLAMLLHMHDLQAVFASGRTRWFINTSPAEVLEEFRQAMQAHAEWSLPGRFVRCQLHARPVIELEKVVQELLGERERRRDGLLASIKQFYAGKDTAFWRKRFDEASSGGKPLKALGVTSRFTTVLQHSMSELKSAARKAGAEMEISLEPDDQSLESPLLDRILELKPDLIVQLSRMRYENPYMPRDLPFLTWDQDNLACMRTPEATKSLDDLTFVAGHGAVFGYTNLHWPRRNCIFCHAAAATIRYHCGPAAPDLLAKHACDVSYVSNASETPEALAMRLRERWKGGTVAAFFDELVASLGAPGLSDQTWDSVALRNLVRSSAAARGVALDARMLGELTMDLNTFADRAYRQTSLEWVSRWCQRHGKTLRLYGGGWEAHPTLAKWAAGRAMPGEEARAVFQASRINLQLMQPGFIHSRALDGLASGGFFLTRWTNADGIGSADIATLYRLASWVVAHGIQTDEALDAVSDAEVRAMTAATRAYYLRCEVTEPLCPSLHVWARIPVAGVLFPQLGSVAFRNEVEFGALAEKYLADDALRTRVAAEMRAVVEQQFSYRARWEAFVNGIHDGLQASTVPVARGE